MTPILSYYRAALRYCHRAAAFAERHSWLFPMFYVIAAIIIFIEFLYYPL